MPSLLQHNYLGSFFPSSPEYISPFIIVVVIFPFPRFVAATSRPLTFVRAFWQRLPPPSRRGRRRRGSLGFTKVLEERGFLSDVCESSGVLMFGETSLAWGHVCGCDGDGEKSRMRDGCGGVKKMSLDVVAPTLAFFVSFSSVLPARQSKALSNVHLWLESMDYRDRMDVSTDISV